MSKSRKSASKAELKAGNKNVHCLNNLKHELEGLDKEKEYILHNMRHDATQFRGQRPDELRPASGSNSRVGSASHGHLGSLPSSGHASPRPDSSKTSRSPRASPHLKPSSAAGNRTQATFVTDLGSSKSPEGDLGSGVPQIVVSNATGQKRKGSMAPKRRGSIQRGASPAQPGSDSGSDTGASPLSLSLNFPPNRSRSNSLAAGSPGGLLRRHTHLPDQSPSGASLGPADDPRSRSSSFSGIEPARRRGSIMEQWGSISERNKGGFKGRRGSVDMENFLRDLSFGVQHSELMQTSPGKARSVSDQQWEELRKCRSKDNSAEDISEETE
ncbi:hypothetical protein ACOMHN_013464 [Nucella lapillus]